MIYAGIGDIRSRLVRLIPQTSSAEGLAIKAFFNHRLPSATDSARLEWLDIVEATHPLWIDISSAKQELIRSFLNLFNLEIVKRARPSSVFNFAGASIGNIFLTAARIFTGSFEASIYLLSSICNVPTHTKVLPAINTNFTHHIAAGLADGDVILGQNSISHPSEPTAVPDVTSPSELEENDQVEDANLPGTLPTLRKGYTSFSKEHEEDLSARIDRIWYINPYGQEIRPYANPQVVRSLDNAQAVIYSIGSLYTSLIPNLVLRGVGKALTSSNIRYKILILNSSVDRETGPSSDAYTARDFVAKIAEALSSSQQAIPVSEQEKPLPSQYRTYVTHLIHLHGPGTPVVDKADMAALGIECIKVYGRNENKRLVYDERALFQAIEAIIGRVEAIPNRSRRNTSEM